MSLRRAFTLIEMVLSLVIVSIILGAVGAASQVILRTARLDISASTVRATSARAAIDQISDDLTLASSIPEQGATAITMIVPDRDGDSVAERIRYAWSGVNGAPLTRQYNERAAVTIADNVSSLNFRHVLRTVGPPRVPDPVEGPEQLFASSEGLLLYSEHGIRSSSGASQYFKPSLPADAISWRVTRIKVQIRRNGGSTASAEYSIMPAASSFTPTGNALDTGSISLTTIGSGQTAWIEVPFANASGISPADGVCIVATASSGAVAYYSRYSALALSLTSAFATRTNNGNWSGANSLQSMQFYVYGTVTTQP